jgi:DNA-binding Lrp family transcriptional regulator
MKNHPFDKIDYEIIKRLNANSRISASEIAREIDANERTIRKRIERLIESGAVRMTTIVDPKIFGYWISVDIFLEMDMEKEEIILEELGKLPQISYLAFGQGTHAISIEARFKDNQEMNDFLHHRLPAIPGLKVAGYTLVPLILRNIDHWLPLPEDFAS